MNNFTVYRHTAPNGKMYIGITCQPIEKRWANGAGYSKQPLFFNAIKKYGWANFKHEVLLEGLDAQNASLAEQLFIAYWKSNERAYGYNCREGGIENSGHSEETRRKIGDAQRGEKNHMYGKTYRHSEETKMKISSSHMGYKHTEEAKRKMSESRMGMTISKETRQKMSESHKGYVMPESMRLSRRRNKRCRPVEQIDKTTGDIIKTFFSMSEASRQTGVNTPDIVSCCKGKLNTAGGYIWRYYDEYIEEERRNAI